MKSCIKYIALLSFLFSPLLLQAELPEGIYWTLGDPRYSGGYRILAERSDLNGANRRILLQEAESVQETLLSDIAVDPVGGWIYYVDLRPSIFRTTLYRPSRQRVLSSPDLSDPSDLVIDQYDRVLLWTDARGADTWPGSAPGNPYIGNSSLNGTSISEFPITQTDVPIDIQLTADGKYIYWVKSPFTWDGVMMFPGSIHRMKRDGTDQQVIVENAGGLYGIAIDDVGQRLYWADFYDSKIKSVALDGSGPVAEFSTVMSGEAEGNPYASSPFDVEVDPIGRYLYWTQPYARKGAVRRTGLRSPGRRIYKVVNYSPDEFGSIWDEGPTNFKLVYRVQKPTDPSDEPYSSYGF